MKKHWSLVLALIFTLIGVSFMIYFAFSKGFNDGSYKINHEISGDYGSLISGLVGPIFSIVGFLLLYTTIILQNKSFEIQQFEAKFFELIKYHRENVSQMELIDPWNKVKSKISGRDVFIWLKKEYFKLYSIVEPIIKADRDIPTEKYDKEILNSTFLIFYIGVSLNLQKSLKNLLSKNYSTQTVNKLIYETRKVKRSYNKKIVFFDGHQSKLGYYFRHLYQSVKFVHSCSFLNDSQKKDYIKLYRAQLSTYEQALLFFDSMSYLGNEWRKTNLITTYELIKNIPAGFLDDIDPKIYYPEIHFEIE